MKQEEQIERLNFLFNNKVLDIFVRSCEILMSKGVDLAAQG